MRHELNHVLPYTPAQLFALVGDVEAYPRFVPWVTSMRTWNQRELSPGVDTLDAEAQVGFSLLKERFATRVTRDSTADHVRIDLLHGPFRHLTSNWRFTPEGEGAKLHFDIDFAFKSRLLETLLAANFQYAVDKLVACFEARAHALYGATARPAASAAP